MKKYLVFTSCAVVLCCGVLIYQNSRRETENAIQFPISSSQIQVSSRLLASWSCGDSTRSATFSRDDKWLLLGSSSTDIYRTSNWSLFRTLSGTGEADFSPDGTLVAASNATHQSSGMGDNAPGVGIWRLGDGKRLQILNDSSGLYDAVGVWGPVAFSPDGHQILTLGEDPNTRWRPFVGGTTEATTYRDIALKVWDVPTGKRIKVLPGPSWGAYLSASVAWVRTSTRGAGQFEPRHFREGSQFCQLPDRTLSVQIHHNESLLIKDLTTKSLVRSIPFGGQVSAAALSPDGALVAGGSAGNVCMIKIWRVADGKLLAKFEGKGHKTGAIAFAPDGKKLIVVGRGDSSSDIAAVYAL